MCFCSGWGNLKDACSSGPLCVNLSALLDPLDQALDGGACVHPLWHRFVFLLELAPGRVARDALLQPCRLARAPVWSLHLCYPNVERMQTVALSSSSDPGEFPQILETSHRSPIFSMWSHALLCCAEAIQLDLNRLSREISLNIGVHSMCSWERVSSASSFAAILDPSLYKRL